MNELPCQACSGTGLIAGERCGECSGAGTFLHAPLADRQDYQDALVLVPDSLGRPLAARVQLLLDNLRRESALAVKLREKLHEVAGAEIASSVQ